MTASTPEEIEAYRLLALRAGLKLEAVGMKMSKGRSAFSIVKKMTGLPGRSAKELLPLYEDLLRQYGILSLKKTMMNPGHRRNPVKSPRGWKIQTASANGWADVKSSDGGSYKTDYYSSKAEAQSELAELAETHGDYGSWRVVPASTRANDDIYENPVHPRRGESERDFVSRCMSEEKMKFPKQKQRIAVCLSKARRNPFPDRNADE